MQAPSEFFISGLLLQIFGLITVCLLSGFCTALIISKEIVEKCLQSTLQMFIGNYRVFTGKSECRDFKFMGIACIPAIPVILKSPHSYLHCDICREFDFSIAISTCLPKLRNYRDCGYTCNPGIAGVHAIPINLKSLHSDFSLQSPCNSL